MPLSKKQKQLDKTGDGKITREDLMILRKSKKKKNGKAYYCTDKKAKSTFSSSHTQAHEPYEEAYARG